MQFQLCVDYKLACCSRSTTVVSVHSGSYVGLRLPGFLRILTSRFWGWSDQGLAFDMAANSGSVWPAVVVFARCDLAIAMGVGRGDGERRRDTVWERPDSLSFWGVATVPLDRRWWEVTTSRRWPVRAGHRSPLPDSFGLPTGDGEGTCTCRTSEFAWRSSSAQRRRWHSCLEHRERGLRRRPLCSASLVKPQFDSPSRSRRRWVSLWQVMS